MIVRKSQKSYVYDSLMKKSNQMNKIRLFMEAILKP